MSISSFDVNSLTDVPPISLPSNAIKKKSKHPSEDDNNVDTSIREEIYHGGSLDKNDSLTDFDKFYSNGNTISAHKNNHNHHNHHHHQNHQHRHHEENVLEHENYNNECNDHCRLLFCENSQIDLLKNSTQPSPQLLPCDNRLEISSPSSSLSSPFIQQREERSLYLVADEELKNANNYSSLELPNKFVTNNGSLTGTKNYQNNKFVQKLINKEITNENEERTGISSANNKCGHPNNCDSIDCDRAHSEISRPENLTGTTGQRYISRSSRVNSKNNDASSLSNINSTLRSTLPSNHQNHRLKSPLKSPSKCTSQNFSSSTKESKLCEPRSNAGQLHIAKVSRDTLNANYIQDLKKSPQSSPRDHRNISAQLCDNSNLLTVTGTNKNLMTFTSRNIPSTRTSRLRAAAMEADKKRGHSENSSPFLLSPTFYMRNTSNNSSDTNKSNDEDDKSPTRRTRPGISALRKGSAPSTPTAGNKTSRRNFISTSARRTSHRPLSPSTVPCESSPSPTLLTGGRSRSAGASLLVTRPTIESHSRNSLERPLKDTRSNRMSISPRNEERDKSSKRKSNLNRALNEESIREIVDDDGRHRRRNHREVGMIRHTVNTEDKVSSAVDDFLSPFKSAQKQLIKINNKQSISMTPILSTASKDCKSVINTETSISYKVNKEKEPDNLEIIELGIVEEFPEQRHEKNSELVDKNVESLKMSMTPFSEDINVPLIESKESSHEENHRKDYLMKKRYDTTRKVDAIRERTKCDLAEIKKIAERCSLAPVGGTQVVQNSSKTLSEVSHRQQNIKKDKSIEETKDINKIETNNFSSETNGDSLLVTSTLNNFHVEASTSGRSPIKKDRISFDDSHNITEIIEFDPNEAPASPAYSSLDGVSMNSSSQRRILKARSHDKELCSDQHKISPILRRKSTDDQAVVDTINTITFNGAGHVQQIGSLTPIVSILKRKSDHSFCSGAGGGESSSASSNPSPVTFSPSVIDIPTKSVSSKRQGILKKRSSLDESRYYGRSHSPDFRTQRRNSLEDTTNIGGSNSSLNAHSTSQHGILKQRSYESKSDGCPSVAEPPHHGILKKKDSSSTPSESSHSKHVSISQAVILAAAELCKEIITSESNSSDYIDIKPILKTDSQEFRVPKPILKKKSSTETEEIRPILKSSRKSSREESDNDDHNVRPILKVESPLKKRSLTMSSSPFETRSEHLQRSKSLEVHIDAGGRKRGTNRNSYSNSDDENESIFNRIRSRSLNIPLRKQVVTSPMSNGSSHTNRVNNNEYLDDSTKRNDSDNNSEMDEDNKRVSILERIRKMESFITRNKNVSFSGAIPKERSSRREICKSRFKTQPITVDELNCIQTTVDLFKPSCSLDSLNVDGKINANCENENYKINADSSRTELDRNFPLSSNHNNNLKFSKTKGSFSDFPDLLSSNKVREDNEKSLSQLLLGKSSSEKETEKVGNDSFSSRTTTSLESNYLSLSGNSDHLHRENSFKINENNVSSNKEEKEKLSLNSIEKRITRRSPSPSGVNLIRNKNNVRAKPIKMYQSSINDKQKSGEDDSSRAGEERQNVSTTDESQNTDELSIKTAKSEGDNDFEPSSLPFSEKVKFFNNLNRNYSLEEKKKSSKINSQELYDKDNRIFYSNEDTSKRGATQTDRNARKIGKVVISSLFTSLDDTNSNCRIIDQMKTGEPAPLPMGIKIRKSLLSLSSLGTTRTSTSTTDLGHQLYDRKKRISNASDDSEISSTKSIKKITNQNIKKLPSSSSPIANHMEISSDTKSIFSASSSSEELCLSLQSSTNSSKLSPFDQTSITEYSENETRDGYDCCITSKNDTSVNIDVRKKIRKLSNNCNQSSVTTVDGDIHSLQFSGINNVSFYERGNLDGTKSSIENDSQRKEKRNKPKLRQIKVGKITVEYEHIENFDDIPISEEELLRADEDFDRLFGGVFT